MLMRSGGRLSVAAVVGRMSSRLLLVADSAPFFFLTSRRRHTRYRDWSSDVCSSDLIQMVVVAQILVRPFYNLANKSEYEREIRIRFKKETKNQHDINKKKKIRKKKKI